MENKKSPDFTLQVNETYSSTVATIAPGLKIFSKHQFLQEVCWMLSKIATTKSYKYIKIYVKKNIKLFDFLYIVLDWQTSFARILGGPEASNRSEFCLFLKTFISCSSIDLHEYEIVQKHFIMLLYNIALPRRLLLRINSKSRESLFQTSHLDLIVF